MKRGGPLARRAGLARTAWKPKRGRTKAEARSEWSAAYCRRVVGERSGGACEVQVLGVCAGVGAEWQHRKARSRGGEWNPANGLQVCSPCHAWIHAHPTAAEEAGWTVRTEDDPAEVPVEYPCWGRVLLDDHGSIHLVQKGQSA